MFYYLSLLVSMICSYFFSINIEITLNCKICQENSYQEEISLFARQRKFWFWFWSSQSNLEQLQNHFDGTVSCNRVNGVSIFIYMLTSGKVSRHNIIMIWWVMLQLVVNAGGIHNMFFCFVSISSGWENLALNSSNIFQQIHSIQTKYRSQLGINCVYFSNWYHS